MAKSSETEVTCPKCGQTGKTEIWQSINAVLDPELIEPMHEKSLFIYECPHCGKKTLLEYPVLFNDLKNKVIIQYVCSENDIDGAVDMLDDLTAAAGLGDAPDDTRFRIVTSLDALIEKSLIFMAREQRLQKEGFQHLRKPVKI